jgi:hypothetical protein
MKLSLVSSRTIRVAMLITVCAGLAGCVPHLGRRSSCETDAHAIRGEVRLMPQGKLMYFDGRCWTTKPMPPTDTPF